MPAIVRPRLFAILLTLAACPSEKGDTDSSTTDTDTSSATEAMTEPTSSATESSATEATESSATESSATESSATESSATESSATDDTDTGGPVFVDLFSCPAPHSCARIVMHIDPEPHAALECAARLIVSTSPGIISALDTPGPDVDETETLVISRGDGSALVQTRERHCTFEEPECDFEIPWEPASAQQLCKLDIPVGLAESCGCGEDSCQGCTWHPFFGALVDCAPVVEEIGCEQLDALVGDGT